MKKIDRDVLTSLIKEARESSLLATPAKGVLNESSLSRVMHHMDEHDTAIISAFRDDPHGLLNCAEGSSDTEINPDAHEGKLNKRRNRDLKATLLSFGYGVTRVDGSYIENFDTPQAIEVAEESFFVVNLEDSTEFFDDIAMLGEQFCQDSVLLIPKGGGSPADGGGAYLLGTNNSDFPGYEEKVGVGNRYFGGESEFMTRVRGRPFTFAEGLTTYKSLSRNERMVVRKLAEKVINAARSRTID